MTKSFDVLDRSLDLHRNYLLEASAGTGKTFSIQHLVVRLLVESDEADPISLDKILVVTFTRAATRDLKMRIRMTIEEALKDLDEALLSESVNIPDYLKAIIDKGEKGFRLAKKRLQQALFLFDQAQIFTIHSFCARMLRQYSIESDTGLHTTPGDKPLPLLELKGVIRDFFRTGMGQKKFSAFQMERYLKKDPDQKKLLKLMQSQHLLLSTPSFEESCIQFNEKMKTLKRSNCLLSDRMIDDFCKQAPVYANYSKETKDQTLEKVTRFAKLFDQDQWNGENLERLLEDGLVWTKALDPKLLKKDPPDPKDLHYPDLTQQLASTLQSLVEEAGDFSFILARLALACRLHFLRYQQEEEKLSPDDVLAKMGEALEHPSFFSKVRSHYQAVIVDEFQDTDPLQWQIFSRLFLSDDHSWKGHLVLVGDPKQSIYSFRQADIYTYLAAAEAIGEQNCLSLAVNYRSHAPLIQALNLVFSQEHLPSFIPLPKKASDLSCPPVKAAKEGQLFDDQRGSIHFFIADCPEFKKPSLQLMEEKVFFPFIAAEISRLKSLKSVPYSRFAVLIRNRKQALRLAEYFGEKEIPFLNQRGTSIASSPALPAFSSLIQALLHPRDRGKILAAFGSTLGGWTEQELNHPDGMEFVIHLIQRLKLSFNERGFSEFFSDLLGSVCKPGGPTVLEQLLATEHGLDFYRDLQQLADCIADHQYMEWNGMEGILPFLDQFQLWEQNEDERAKRLEDPAKEGVKILTLHMSKGLEFDIVFALGLVNREDYSDDLIPIESNGQTILSPVNEESSAHRQYCEERDSEKMRQLYVALTRAKHQLYVPAALHFPSETVKYGEASPLDLFLARLHQPAASYQTLYERIRTQTGNHLIDFIEKIGKHNFITYSVHQELSFESESQRQSQSAPHLKAPIQVIVPGKPMWMTSFTTLSKQAEHTSEKRFFSSLCPPSDYGCVLKDAHSLPAGSDTGVLIHRIFEKFSFADFEKFEDPEQAVPLVRPFLLNTPFKEWEQTIAKLIFNTLKAKIPVSHPSFSLARIEPESMYREMPFLFPFQEGGGVENILFKDGLIKGVIDMLFCQDGYYYLLDWKTNWLGPQLQSYAPDCLESAMRENAYFLQASIYTEAVKRYLKLVDPRPFEECFGGVFYLFVRGMHAGESTGIYHF